VYYEDTDAGGIVYYANYLRFFERARTEWLRALGATHARLEAEDGLLFVVRDFNIEYLKPARLDDELVIAVRVAQARRASLTLEQSARIAGSDEILVKARARVATLRRGATRPSPLPQWLLQELNR
ncbi:MAG: tol-pal system-associated acyl-CoA thioesterase, partial [Burkholderiaceae bacterium]|nr:tol-pal system-associated acyl-CoA thioesterase [Burkholderiaceae bacterium]